MVGRFAVRTAKPEGKGVVLFVFVLQLGVVGSESEPVPPQPESSAAGSDPSGGYGTASITVSVTSIAEKTICWLYSIALPARPLSRRSTVL